MGFLGAAIFGAIAYASESVPEREHALAQGEALLREPCVSHCHLWFYWNAIDASLTAGEWDAARRYAAALDEFVSGEPLPWARVVVGRARALAAVGVNGSTDPALSELRRLREQASLAGFGSVLPAIDARLTTG
jgi:hypothetical protein